jgi:hypothetical protein
VNAAIRPIAKKKLRAPAWNLMRELHRKRLATPLTTEVQRHREGEDGKKYE